MIGRKSTRSTVPRNKTLNKYTVGSICDFLIENGYEERAIKNAFKWR